MYDRCMSVTINSNQQQSIINNWIQTLGILTYYNLAWDWLKHPILCHWHGKLHAQIWDFQDGPHL